VQVGATLLQESVHLQSRVKSQQFFDFGFGKLFRPITFKRQRFKHSASRLLPCDQQMGSEFIRNVQSDLHNLRIAFALLIFRPDVVEEVEAQLKVRPLELFRQLRIRRCSGNAAPGCVVERYVA
jgi:hypothetical protein